MRRRAIASFIAACALSACASQTAPAAPGDMAWFDVEGDGPKLAFGPPESEAVLMLTCTSHSGEVLVSLAADPKVGAHALQIRSGAARMQLAAEGTSTDPEELALEATLPVVSPILASFARTGELAVGVGGATALPKADPRMADRFVKRCR